MHKVTTVELSRDCEAVQIPAGDTVLLSAGTSVDITQQLGGSCTVHANGGLFRIADKDADALGLGAAHGSESTGPAQETVGPVDEAAIWEVLKSCYDPEIPVNIVDLGLVYDLHIENLPSGRSKVDVKMTLTAAGCGMGSVIAGEAQQRILELAGVEDAHVEIVWDPPWHPTMISAAGKAVLGME